MKIFFAAVNAFAAVACAPAQRASAQTPAARGGVRVVRARRATARSPEDEQARKREAAGAASKGGTEDGSKEAPPVSDEPAKSEAVWKGGLFSNREKEKSSPSRSAEARREESPVEATGAGSAGVEIKSAGEGPRARAEGREAHTPLATKAPASVASTRGESDSSTRRGSASSSRRESDSPSVLRESRAPSARLRTLVVGKETYLLLLRAREAREGNRGEEAVAFYRGAIESNGGYFAPANLELGFTLAGLGRREEAVASLRAVTEREPTRYPLAFYHLGRLYEQLDQLEQADAALTRAIELMGDRSLQFFVDLSRVREREGKYAEALSAAEQYVRAMERSGAAPDWARERVTLLQKKAAANGAARPAKN